MISERPLIGIVLLPEVELGRPSGGAEAVAEQVLKSLALDYDVAIFNGSPPRSGDELPRRLGENIWAWSAFPSDAEAEVGGVIAKEKFGSRARQSIEACAMILGFERVISGLEHVVQCAVVGGVGYPHCKECMQSGNWDCLIVPSDFVANHAVEQWNVRGQIHVIPNGLDPAVFDPGPQALDPIRMAPERPRFLLAGRADPGKGLIEAVEFCRWCMTRGDRPILVVCGQQSSQAPCSANRDPIAAFPDIEFDVRPWTPRDRMPAVYRECSLSLCLGSIPEGFGLTAAESIACGTPVLARPQGALATLLPAGHGLDWIELGAAPLPAESLGAALMRLKLECLSRGSTYIHRHYAEAAMIERYCQLVAGVVTPKVVSGVADDILPAAAAAAAARLGPRQTQS